MIADPSTTAHVPAGAGPTPTSNRPSPLRKWSILLSVVGGAFLVAAAVFLVTTSMGTVVETMSDSTGRTVTREYATPSVMED